MAVFVWSLSLEHDGANLAAASSNSDATDSGLDLILPLAAYRPQDRVPPLNRECVRAHVKMNPQVCKYLSTTKKKVTFTMAAKSRKYNTG